MHLDAATRQGLRHGIDRERRQRLFGSPTASVSLLTEGGSQKSCLAMQAWEAAGGDPLRALMLAVDLARAPRA